MIINSNSVSLASVFPLGHKFLESPCIWDRLSTIPRNPKGSPSYSIRFKVHDLMIHIRSSEITLDLDICELKDMLSVPIHLIYNVGIGAG